MRKHKRLTRKKSKSCKKRWTRRAWMAVQGAATLSGLLALPLVLRQYLDIWRPVVKPVIGPRVVTGRASMVGVSGGQVTGIVVPIKVSVGDNLNNFADALDRSVG